MKRKIIFLIVMLMNISLVRAVILTNGKNITLSSVNKVYSIIKNLDDNNRFEIINDLYLAVHSNDNIVKPKLAVWFWVKNRTLNHEINEQEVLNEISNLGLCDSSGKINEQIADIISCTISNITYKGILPIAHHLKSPISWKNYFKISYWVNKE